MSEKDTNPPHDFNRTTSVGGNTDLDVTSDLNDPSRPPADAPHTPPISESGGSDAAGANSGGSAGENSGGGRSGRALMQLGQYALLGSPDGKSSQPVHGGEGCVYLAQRLDGGPKVALKTPLPKYADRPQRCKRLIKEAQHLQSMDHPAIVKVYEIVADHEPPFYTMTCLPNGSLAERLEEGQPMGHDEVLRISVPLAGAVQYVHEKKGVSHRDIKPQNVMMDENDQPVFVDFGLSRDNTGDQASIVDPESDASASRFKVGTLLYMAPELFEGKAGNSQTDIYAFGVMLYVMATGKRPYDGRDFDTLSVQKRLAEPIEPLAAHPDLDPRLAQVIAHATARRAKDRYATMEDLHEDLQSVRDSQTPVHADAALPKGEPSETKKATNRPSVMKKLAAAAAFLVAASAGAYGAYYYVDHLNASGAEEAQTSSAHHPGGSTGSNSGPEQPTPTTSPVEGVDLPEQNVTTHAKPEPRPDEVTTDPPHHGATPPKPSDVTPQNTETPPSETVFLSLFTDEIKLVNDLVGDFSARLNRDPALDAKAVAALDELLRVTEGQSRRALRNEYPQWIHDAAKYGATDSLAWLIQHAPEFDTSSNAETDAGHHWLQTAVRSPENQAFAAALPQWMETHEIDPAVLTAHAIGTDAPLTMARDFGRDTWVAALRAAAQAFDVDLND